MPRRSLRSCGHLESEFLSRRRSCRTALLFRLAADANPSAEFPRSGSLWRIGLCTKHYGAKVAGWLKWCGRSRLAYLLFFPYAFPVKRPPRYLRYFMAECFPRAFCLILYVVALACGGSAPPAPPPPPAQGTAPSGTKNEPPPRWGGITPAGVLALFRPPPAGRPTAREL